MKAHAVVFTQKNRVEFLEVDCPEPGPRDVVIKTTHSWISNGTEGSYLRGERIGGDTPYRPGDPIPFPIVPGYQQVGVVEAVGREVADLTPGETVFCSSGKVNNMYYPAGGHISPCIAERDWIWKLPASPRPLAFSGMLLTQVGYNVGSRAPLPAGQPAVVIGDGPVGQWAAQTLTWRGAEVAMVGMDDYRLDLAQRLIKCRTVNITKTEWTAAVRNLYPQGIAVAADTAGSRDATEKIIPLMQRSGHIVSAGFCGTDDKISLQALRDRELSLDSVASCTHERMNKTLTLIAQGDLQTLPLITHHFPAADAAKAWQIISQRTIPVLGVVLDW